MPKRIQQRRTKGWRKPAGAVSVARPSKWGNPYRVADAREAGYRGTGVELAEMCVNDFRRDLIKAISGKSDLPQSAEIVRLLPELRGKDLMCWCPLGSPCHADVLLELANR